MICSFDLHLEQEANLKVVNFNEKISSEDIKITYKMAIEKIHNLSLDTKYKQYFYRILDEEQPLKNKTSFMGTIKKYFFKNKDEEQNPDCKASFIGAAVNKLSGSIYIVIKDENDKYALIMKLYINNYLRVYYKNDETFNTLLPLKLGTYYPEISEYTSEMMLIQRANCLFNWGKSSLTLDEFLTKFTVYSDTKFTEYYPIEKIEKENQKFHHHFIINNEDIKKRFRLRQREIKNARNGEVVSDC